jgi:hypothetical protein
MNIAQAIMHLFPQANPMIDFIVQDDSDGEGPYLAQWNIEAPQPTEEELQAAWEAYLVAEAGKPKPETDQEKIARLEAKNAIQEQQVAELKEGSIQTNNQVIDLWENLLNAGVL